MLNNIESLFLKYKQQFQLKSEIEDKIINFFKKELNLALNNSNLKIDLKNKKFKLVNLNSATRFYLESQKNQTLIDNLFKETNYKLII